MVEKTLQGERCDFCEIGTLRFKRVREFYRKGEDVVIIDDVPAFVCNYCGERYYLAEVSKKMRHIAENGEKLKNRISVPVAEYGESI